MKARILLAAALVTLAGLTLSAQQPDSAAQQNTSQQDAAAFAASLQTSSTPRASIRMQSLRPVHAELIGKLDAKTAKPGDTITLKTQEPVRTADGTEIPKGAKILGHVLTVKPHSKESPNSRITVAFDRAELKGGQTLSLQSELRWVAPAPMEGPSAIATQNNIGGGVMGGATPVMGGSPGGGLGTGSSGGMSVSGGRLVDNNKTPDGMNSVSQYGVATTGNDGSGSGPTDLRPGANANVPHITAIHGLMLAGDASGITSGSLTAANQNVHLDGGSIVVLGIITTK